MPIPVGCPTCGAVLPVPDEFAGAAVRCGGCGHPVQVPAAGDPPALPVARRVPVLKRTGGDDDDRPRPARRSPKPVAAPTLTTAGRVWLSVLGVATAGGCVTLLVAAAGGVRTAAAAAPVQVDRPRLVDRRPALVPPPAQVFAPEPEPERPFRAERPDRPRRQEPKAFEPLQFDEPAPPPNAARPAPPFGGRPVPPPFRPSTNALVKRYVGRLTASASSQWGNYLPGQVIDGEERTSWFASESGRNPRPWLEVRFPEDVTVRRVTVLGNRDPRWGQGYTVTAARLELRAADDTLLASADLAGVGPKSDFEFAPAGGRGLARVRAVRFVVTAGERLHEAAVGEVQVE